MATKFPLLCECHLYLWMLASTVVTDLLLRSPLCKLGYTKEGLLICGIDFRFPAAFALLSLIGHTKSREEVVFFTLQLYSLSHLKQTGTPPSMMSNFLSTMWACMYVILYENSAKHLLDICMHASLWHTDDRLWWWRTCVTNFCSVAWTFLSFYKLPHFF